MIAEHAFGLAEPPGETGRAAMAAITIPAPSSGSGVIARRRIGAAVTATTSSPAPTRVSPVTRTTASRLPAATYRRRRLAAIGILVSAVLGGHLALQALG